MDIKKESLVGSSIINFESETISNPSGISNFHTKCGEVFVSKNNEFLVTCCQCNGSFGKFDIYLDHMKKLHLDNQFEKENSVDLSSNHHTQFNNSKQRNTMDFYMERDQMEFISNNNQITASHPHPPQPVSYLHHQQQHLQSISSHHIPPTIVNNPMNFINPSEYKPIIEQSINNSLINNNNNRKSKIKLTTNSTVHHHNNHSYKCEYCHKEFTQSQNLTVHKRVHTGEKPYTCEFCNKSFSHKSNLNVHKRTHTGGYKPNNKRNNKLENHQQQQQQLTGYNSNSSSNSTTQNTTNNYIEVPVNPYFMATSTQILPVQHSNNKIPENFQQNQFITSSSLVPSQNNNNINNNDLNNIQSDGLYKCEYCHKTFSQSQNLVVHKRIHTGEKPYTCEFCDKSFSHKSNLNVHKRTHTGLKPYKCDICEKLFSDKSALIVHKRLHSGEKPFQCRFCDRSFAMKNDLKQHENTHTGEKPHQCETCDKSFANNSNLIIHRRIHTGEKPYECDVCYKAFRHNSNLIVHKRTHSNNNNNSTNTKNDCDDKIIKSTILINNNKQINSNNCDNEKIYHCNLCEKTYMNNSSLYTHKRTHHRENTNSSNNTESMMAIGNESLKLSMGLN